MSCKPQLLLISLCAVFAYGKQMPSTADLNWEDFGADIEEEDSTEALSLIQQRVRVIQAPKARDDVSENDISEAVASEDGTESTGLALVQTDAHVERASTVSDDGHVMGAVGADGTIEMSYHQEAMSNDGVMHLSVDGNGEIHSEYGMSLLQTDAALVDETPAPSAPPSNAKAGNILKSRKADDVTASELNDLSEDEGLSMMQTEVKTSTAVRESTIIPYSVAADGTVIMNPKEMTTPSDGVMSISVDGNADFHAEEGLMLMQTSTEVSSSAEKSVDDAAMNEAVEEAMATEWDPSLVGSTVEGHPSWTLQAATKVDGLSLVQTGAKKHYKSSSPQEGSMMLSVDSNGHFIKQRKQRAI